MKKKLNLINNFSELLDYHDLRELNRHNFLDSKLTVETFNKNVDVEILNEEELVELDKYIEDKIKGYTIYYEHVLLKPTPNFKRNNKNSNKRDDKKITQAINSNNISEAVETYSLKKHEAIDDNETNKFIVDKNLSLLFKECKNNVSRERTVNFILSIINKDLKALDNDFLNNEECLYLAMLMSYEIYLRCKLKDEYVYSENAEKIKKDYRKSVQYKNELLISEITKMKKDNDQDIDSIMMKLKLKNLLK